MKNFLVGLTLSLALAFLPSLAQAATQAGVDNGEFGMNHFSAEQAQKYQLGTAVFKHSKRYVKCLYSFAIQGGASGSSLNLVDEHGSACKVPNKAIITNVYIDVLTAGTTSASGTMELTAQSAGDLKAALAAASYTGIVAGIPVGTAATAIKMTADRTISGKIATGPFTAGKWNVLISYLMSE